MVRNSKKRGNRLIGTKRRKHRETVCWSSKMDGAIRENMLLVFFMVSENSIKTTLFFILELSSLATSRAMAN